MSATCLVFTCSISLLHARDGGGESGASLQDSSRSQASPASQPPPQTTTPQTFPQELVEAGRLRFGAQCGFCHGRDSAGGTGGSDLTRSELVAADVAGDRILPVVRNGRPDGGMPAFDLSDDDLDAIVAFIHQQKANAASATGGRRAVAIADLTTGNAETGKRYFDNACPTCHSVTGDLAGIGTRLQGLELLRRMLYPGSEGGGCCTSGGANDRTVTVTTRAGQAVTGTLVHRDEFFIALTDRSGWYRSWPTNQVDFRVDDPLQAHVDQLGTYTDDAMHDVLAYLQTLR